VPKVRDGGAHLGARSISHTRYWCAAKLHPSATAYAPSAWRARSIERHFIAPRPAECRLGGRSEKGR